jgi:prepilin-type N-terminal cleavage/methylation domain-containing protein
MKKMNLKKGFTLIELLVVVAIIGILASVVLSSLNTARGKGSDAAVKANLAGMRAQAELYYDGTGNGKYNAAAGSSLGATGAAGAVCGLNTGMFSDANITQAIAQVAAQMDSTSTMTCTVDSTGQKWAVSITKLKGAATTWCVDNSGWSKAGATSGASGTPGTGTGVCA